MQSSVRKVQAGAAVCMPSWQFLVVQPLPSEVFMCTWQPFKAQYTLMLLLVAFFFKHDLLPLLLLLFVQAM